MALSSFTVTIITKSDSPFNVIPNAPIEIRERLASGSSGGLSLIFSDSAGLNPITQAGATTNSLGQISFFAAAADYNAVYDNNGTPVTIAVDVGVTGGILDERFDRLNPDHLDIAINDQSLQEGDLLNAGGRESLNDGGSGFWKAVLSSSVTTDTFSIVQCIGAPSLALVLRESLEVFDTQFGVKKDSPSRAARNVLAWNAGAAYAKSKKIKFNTSGNIYTDNTLFFETANHINFIEPCTILRDNDTKINVFGLRDILSVSPISSSFKGGWKLEGKVKLEYITTTSAADGINFNNSKACDLTGFYCWIDKAHNSITGKSCFSISGGVFAPGNCYAGLKLDPLEAGSAGATCTSLYWTINCFNTVRALNLVNVFYSEFTGYSDGVDLTSPKLPANQFPIGILTRGGCRDVTFNFAFENFEGIAIRQEPGQYCNYSFDTQIGAGNVFEKDGARAADVPLAEQAIFSFEGTGTAIFNSSAADYSLPVLASPGNTFMFYQGSQANVTLNGGFYAKGQYGFKEGPGKQLLKGNSARFVDPFETANLIYHGDGTVTQFTTGTTAGGGKLVFNFPLTFTNASTNELLVAGMVLRGNGIGNVTYETISTSAITCVTDAGDGFVMRISVRGKINN